MKLKSFSTVCFVVLAAIAILAQSGVSGKDPITGTWTGTPKEVTFALKYDGTGTVTGTVVPQPGKIEGTFDSRTGVLKIEGNAQNPSDGKTCRFVIEGKLDNGTIAGTATCGETKVGDFSITRK